VSISFIFTLLFNISPSIASRSNFLHTLRMTLAQTTSKKSTPMRMRPFVRIPLLSRHRRRRIGRPKARNILHLASLLNNVKPRSRKRSRPSKPMVEMPRTRTKKRTRSNWHFSFASLSYAFSYHACSRLRCVFMFAYPNPRKDHGCLCLVLTSRHGLCLTLR
jgi:hypothetical protein